MPLAVGGGCLSFGGEHHQLGNDSKHHVREGNVGICLNRAILSCVDEFFLLLASCCVVSSSTYEMMMADERRWSCGVEKEQYEERVLTTKGRSWENRNNVAVEGGKGEFKVRKENSEVHPREIISNFRIRFTNLALFRLISKASNKKKKIGETDFDIHLFW